MSYMVKTGRPKKNLIGSRYGKVVVIDFAPNYVAPSGKQEVSWKCKCDCGTIFNAQSRVMKYNKATFSCGCERLSEVLNKRFGMLKVIGRSSKVDNWRTHFYKCRCDCGNITYVRPQNLKSTTKSCGCLNDKRRRERRGPNSAAWNPSLSQEDRILKRKSYSDRRWRNEVLSKYNSTCVKCNSTENIEAHHKEGWAENSDLRYTVSNGVALCRDCHIKYHQRYGKINVNSIDFNEWIKEGC